MTLLKCLADFSEDNEMEINEISVNSGVSFDEMAAELYDKYVESFNDTQI
jgi:hypothetical protein